MATNEADESLAHRFLAVYDSLRLVDADFAVALATFRIIRKPLRWILGYPPAPQVRHAPLMSA